MNANRFELNNVFQKNAKIYQTKPIRAAIYQPGMETGWVVYMSNNLHVGMKFFDTEQEAWDYINADNKQYITKDGETVEVAVEYNAPMPVLHRKETDPNKKVGFDDHYQGKYILQSNETDQYDFFILDYPFPTPDTWIIQDADGGIRVCNTDSPDRIYLLENCQ